MSKPKSRYGNPAGPRPVWVLLFIIGGLLVGHGFMSPSLHSIWEVPLGLVLVVSMVGKMTVR